MNTILSFLKKYYICITLFILVSILQYIILQAGCILSDFEAFEYIFRPPKFNTLFQNIAIIGSINLFAWLVLRKLMYALTLTTTLALGIAIIGFLKMYYLTDPILWYDIQHISDGFIAIHPYLTIINALFTIIVIIFIIAIGYGLNRLFPHPPLTRKCSIIFLLFSILIFSSGVLGCLPLPNYALTLLSGSPKRTYRYAGVPVVFTSFILKGNDFKEKENYNKETIEKICYEILKDYQPIIDENEEQPNILLIVQESMMDPLKLNFKFPADPLPNMRKTDSNLHLSGPIAPTYGGGSWNTDFEICTSLSAALFSFNGRYSSATGLRKSFPSIAHVFNTKNYKTHALLPCPQTLFNYKTKFQEHMGFKNYRPIENLFPGICAMDQTSDLRMYEHILNTLNSNTDSPHLIYAQLLENHWPYKIKREKADKKLDPFMNIKAHSKDLYEYLNRLQLSDKRLNDFMNHLKLVQRPTILYTFGDHLPPLSLPIQRLLNLTYTEKQMKKSGSKDSLLILRRHSTFAAYWANKYTITPLPEHASHFFFTSHLYQDLKISHPFHTHFIPQIMKHFNAIFSDGSVKFPNGDIKNSDALSSEGRRLWEMYDLLIFDLCYGKQYSKPLLFPEVKE